MRDWLEQTRELITDIPGQIDDEALSDWNAVIRNEGLFILLNRMCPPGVSARLIFDAGEVRDEGIHAHGCRPFLEDRENRPIVNGTMNAAEDPGYAPVFDRFGWRTVVYLIMDVRHKTSPRDPNRRQDIIADNPFILFSENAEALSPQQIIQLYIAARWLFSAMLLRLGLTLSSNAYERMKNVVPGALLTLSENYIYDANDECTEWFDIDPSDAVGRPMSDILPDNLLEWIQKSIRSRVTRDNRFAATIMQLKKKDGTAVVGEVMLRRTGAFEDLQINERMTMGQERMTLSEASAVLHFLIVRDVTQRWEAEKLEQEMALARRMQMSLLPARLPVSDTFEVAARCRPASHVGGDVYDVFAPGDGRLAVFLGDAVGHGVDSALLAATTVGAYRTALAVNLDPHTVLSSIDQTLRVSDQAGFITAGYLLIDPMESRLRYGLAGQARPVIIRNGRELEFDDTPSSLPLGVKLDPGYCIGSIALEPGDLVTIASDGILEMCNSAGDHFEPRFLARLRCTDGQPLDNLITDIFNAMDEFLGLLKQNDDLTLVIVRV